MSTSRTKFRDASWLGATYVPVSGASELYERHAQNSVLPLLTSISRSLIPVDWHRLRSNIGTVEEAASQIRRVAPLPVPRMCIPTTCGSTIDALT